MSDLWPCKPLRVQSVAYSGTAGVIANPIGAGVNVVRITLTSAGYIAFGAAPVATTAGIYMPADTPDYFIVSPNHKVSAIQASAGGNLHVVEMSY
jgi:hypothetical protein